MISKEFFVKTINKIKALNRVSDELEEALQKFCAISGVGDVSLWGLCFSHESTLVDLLAEIFEDEGDWICWWIWETDFGTKADMTKIKDNGVEINLDTPEKLYDLLIKNMSKQENMEGKND